MKTELGIVKAISVATLVLAATLTVTGVVVSAPAKAKPRATVALVDDAPVTVVGRGFARGERITLRALLGGKSYVRVVRASAAGRFMTSFQAAIAECTPYMVSAVGRSGRIAALKRLEIPPPCGVVNQP